MLNRSRITFSLNRRQVAALAGVTGLGWLLSASPALAHHAMGGRMPANAWEGFLTGLAHPVIGLDHLAFIIAVGLLAVGKTRGWLLPAAFVLAAMAGTGLHVNSVTLPGAEFLVAGSLLGFGLLLALRHHLNSAALAGLGAIAGLCHGYAYGEAIFGVQTTALVAYLAGFTAIQLVIILGVFLLGQTLLKRSTIEITNPFRSAGWMICGIGLTFLSSQVLKTVFPGV